MPEQAVVRIARADSQVDIVRAGAAGQVLDLRATVGNEVTQAPSCSVTSVRTSRWKHDCTCRRTTLDRSGRGLPSNSHRNPRALTMPVCCLGGRGSRIVPGDGDRYPAGSRQ